MPELPEVETVCRGLSAHLTGRRVVGVLVRRGDLRVPVPGHLRQSLEGRRVTRISRRAKYILFHFDDAQVLIAHLGMSGSMVLGRGKPAPYRKHDHIVIKWDDGLLLRFHDPRRFGLLAFASEKTLAAHPLLAKLGPEPLDEAWNDTHLRAMLSASAAPVKSVIMDQGKLVGVGNIYACEALFLARIDPRRAANRVTKPEAKRLAHSIKQVLAAAIASGGSTLRDYVRSSGDGGYFQHHFSVYGREGLPCTRCGTLIAVIRQSGRSSFFCPACQK